jgi:hypothetical protein
MRSTGNSSKGVSRNLSIARLSLVSPNSALISSSFDSVKPISMEDDSLEPLLFGSSIFVRITHVLKLGHVEAAHCSSNVVI